jgi:hypothetical protein
MVTHLCTHIHTLHSRHTTIPLTLNSTFLKNKNYLKYVTQTTGIKICIYHIKYSQILLFIHVDNYFASQMTSFYSFI